jgi:hypothetical protein
LDSQALEIEKKLRGLSVFGGLAVHFGALGFNLPTPLFTLEKTRFNHFTPRAFLLFRPFTPRLYRFGFRNRDRGKVKVFITHKKTPVFISR